MREKYINKNVNVNNKKKTFKTYSGEGITLEKVYYLNEIEYESGWGSRLEDNYFFKNKEDAEMFKNAYNSHNKEEQAPDWYMTCEGVYVIDANKLNNNEVIIQEINEK